MDSSSNSNGGAAGNNKEDSLHIDMLECQDSNAPSQRRETQDLP